jgi:hypothetical protein
VAIAFLKSDRLDRPYAQFVAPDGKAVGGDSASALGFSFDANRQASSLRLIEGKAPITAHQVVMVILRDAVTPAAGATSAQCGLVAVRVFRTRFARQAGASEIGHPNGSPRGSNASIGSA